MKKVIVKRLVYTFGDGKEHIGTMVNATVNFIRCLTPKYTY